MDKKNSDYIFKAYIVNSSEYDNGNKETSGAWLYFPTSKEDVSALFEKIGLPNDANSDKYFIDDYESGKNDIAKSLSMYTNIDELNYLASRVSELEDIEMTVFQSLIQTEEINSIADAVNLTYNTECYNVVPDIYSWENVGAYIAEQEGFDTSVIGELADYIDYEAYGKDCAERNGGHFLGDIYLERVATDFTLKYDGEIESIPPEYIVTEHGENVQYDYNFDIQLQESMELAIEIDGYLRGHNDEYVSKYPNADEPPVYISDCLIDKCTLDLKDMLTAASTPDGDALVDKICGFEQKYPCDKYMLYQVKDGDQTRDYRYTPYSLLEKWGLNVNKANYEQTYVHYLSEDTTLEKLYTWFNTDIPQDFKGHSMSVSDIVVLHRNGEDKAYYCDSTGFVEVTEFFSEQTKENNLEAAENSTYHEYNQPDKQENNQSQTMTVLVVEPMQEPYTKEIQTGLEALQKEVGGNIQAVYPFAEPAAIICNEEGKLDGLKLNRALYDAEGEIYDIVAGTFLIAGLGEDNFTSLPPELTKQMHEQFKNPEVFAKVNGKIAAISVKPSIKAALNKLQKEKGGKDIPTPQKSPPKQEL